MKYLIVSLSLGSIVAVTIFENHFNFNRTETKIDKVIVITNKDDNIHSVLNELHDPSGEKSMSSDKQYADVILEHTEGISIDTAISISYDKEIPDVETTHATKKNSQQKDKNTYTGYLKNMNDKAIHEFTLSYPSAVNVVFYPSGRDDASYRLTIQDSYGSVLTQKIIEGENLHANTGNLYLRAGTYKIEIGRGYSWSGKPYTITINASQAVDTEEESNDSIQTANVIPLNKDVRASTGTRSDIDYFMFTLEKASSVYPNLNFNPVRNSKGIYNLKLYELSILGINKGPFIFRGDNKPSKQIRPFILEAGTYIIIVSRLEDQDKLELGLHEYTLRVSAQKIM